MKTQPTSEQFYGISLASRNFGEYTFTERQYRAGCTTPLHIHERALLCMVVDGAFEEQQGSKTICCTDITTLYHAAGGEHLERFGKSGARQLIVEIEPTWIDRIRQIAPFGISSSAVQDNGTLRVIGARLYREFVSFDPAARLVSEGLLFEIAGEFFRAETRSDTRKPAWLDRAVEMIQANFPRRLALSKIAEEIGIHPVHLAQSFRRFHGCTVGDFVRRLRIDYACRELARSEVCFIDLAVAAGFADQSHFIRTFKRAVGILPSQYRAMKMRNAPPGRERLEIEPGT
jgi:AraC family transcriptional regulator